MVLVRQLDDEDDDGPLHLPRLVRLELVRGGDDEGDGGDDHHGEGEQRQKLSQLGSPWIFYGVPQPSSPLTQVVVTEVLLLRLLQGSLLGVQVAVLLALTDVQLGEILESAARLHTHVIHGPVLRETLVRGGSSFWCDFQRSAKKSSKG